jgi:hypothetical protein
MQIARLEENPKMSSFCRLRQQSRFQLGDRAIRSFNPVANAPWHPQSQIAIAPIQLKIFSPNICVFSESFDFVHSLQSVYLHRWVRIDANYLDALQFSSAQMLPRLNLSVVRDRINLSVKICVRSQLLTQIGK